MVFMVRASNANSYDAFHSSHFIGYLTRLLNVCNILLICFSNGSLSQALSSSPYNPHIIQNLQIAKRTQPHVSNALPSCADLADFFQFFSVNVLARDSIIYFILVFGESTSTSYTLFTCSCFISVPCVETPKLQVCHRYRPLHVSRFACYAVYDLTMPV